MLKAGEMDLTDLNDLVCLFLSFLLNVIVKTSYSAKFAGREERDVNKIQQVMAKTVSARASYSTAPLMPAVTGNNLVTT